MEREAAFELCDIVLQASRADQTEVRLSGGLSALTRFANNTIHQNVAEQETAASVRAVVGKQIGVASSTDTSPEGLRELADKAYQLARLSATDEDFRSLPESQPYDGPTDFRDPATAAYSPEERAAGVAEVLKLSAAEDFAAAGAFSTGDSFYAIANSLGVRTFQARTGAELSAIVQGETSSGYARAVAPRVAEIEPAALGRIAVEKCRASANPQDLEPGTYTVILEPEAAGDMIMMLGFYDFGALAMQEGRSFMAGKMGERVCGENISICDDGLDPRGQQLAYDFEGIPKQRVDLIKDGVAAGVVWDSYTAGKAGGQSTGHALPAPNDWGPMPLNMFVAPGDSSVSEMIAGTERGLLITRFHYTNMVHPILTVFTGMTRDGTFLIENGQIVGGIKNLRFTQSILDALSCVSAISREGKLTDYVWCPALKIDCFNFSSGTEF